MKREIVVIESGKNRSKFDLLDAALEKAQFVNLLETVMGEKKKPKARFLIVIKPNLAMFFKEKVTVRSHFAF
jgi:hypothetical protein